MTDRITHADVTHVMGTLIEPVKPYMYLVGQYVYVHQRAYETNPLDARECRIEDVSGAPLEIVVRPCNSDELLTVAQDKLSAPIVV